MLGSWQILLSGVVLGFSVAAPPGPVNAAAAYRVTSSWFEGWLTELGGTTSDAVFYVLTYYGLTRLLLGGGIKDGLFLLGAILMLFLAISTLRHGAREPAGRTRTRLRFPYLVGLSIGLTNPFQLAWWVTVGIGMVSTFGISIIVGFFTGILAWNLLYTFLLRTGFRRSRTLYPLIVCLSSAVLIGFALWFLYTAFSSLLR